jgi:hypothetical protein
MRGEQTRFTGIARQVDIQAQQNVGLAGSALQPDPVEGADRAVEAES